MVDVFQSVAFLPVWNPCIMACLVFLSESVEFCSCWSSVTWSLLHFWGFSLIEGIVFVCLVDWRKEVPKFLASVVWVRCMLCVTIGDVEKAYLCPKMSLLLQFVVVCKCADACFYIYWRLSSHCENLLHIVQMLFTPRKPQVKEDCNTKKSTEWQVLIE